MDIKKKYNRNFLPVDEDMGIPDNIKTAYKRLESLPITSESEVGCWLKAWSELQEAVYDVVIKINVATSKDTRNKTAEKEMNRVYDEVVPLFKQLDEPMQKQFSSIPKEFIPKELEIARKNAELSIEIFRKDNLPLLSENAKLENEYAKIVGEWQTEFDGKTLTSQQINPYLESPDREIRKSAWLAKTDMHLADYITFNELFDKLLKTRSEIAKNADVDNFAEYQYKSYSRLSYGSKDVAAFRASILKYVVPAVTKIMERRKNKLRIDSIRPWDVSADPDGKEPPKVYKTLEDLKEKAGSVLGAIDPSFKEGFLLLDKKGYLDLENRPGKAPGAYMTEFLEERLPFMFGNAVGTSRDFDTLIHEAGHAMHSLLSRDHIAIVRDVPLEFAEVASMSLELLARPYWSVIYSDDEIERLGVTQLEDTLIFLPFMAMLDSFQHWVYDSPNGNDPEARAAYWTKLQSKFQPHLNYDGLLDRQQQGWQYNHVFTSPMYYVEYGVAQVGALQVYLRSLNDYDSAVEDYKYALSLGTTATLPDLFKSTGVEFVLEKPKILEEVTDGIMSQVGF